MPVEIKELVIRTVVGPGPAARSDADPGAPPPAATAAPDSGSAEEIVQECVRQVLRILAKNQER